MIEGLRRKSLKTVFAMKTFQGCWPVWSAEICRLTDNFQNPDKIYDLGGHLADVFKLTGGAGRDQGSLSGGGAAWEGLVCWYLNLVMINSRAVVIKQHRSLIPPALASAMTVTYKNVPTNTESDLSGIIFPNDEKFLIDEFDQSILNSIVAAKISEISLHNIQCKTNWNDNAQIPMLWDMIYQFRGVSGHSVHIGVNGYDLDDLKSFTYSFVTVPSQKREIKPNCMAVRRVESLSGGNYWGKPTRSGVAASLSEIFKRVFKSAFDGDIKGHIAKQVQNGAYSLPSP